MKFKNLYLAPAVVAPCGEEPVVEEHVEEAPRSFDQEQVDRIVEQRLAKDRRSRENRSIQASEERDTYRQQVEDLQTELAEYREHEQKVTEERAKREAAKHAKALEEANGQAERYKTAFEASLVEGEVARASAKHGVFNAAQMSSILKPSVVEDESGQFAVVASHNGEMLPLDHILETMKAEPDVYGNLFATDMKSGLGANNMTGSDRLRQPGANGRLSREAIARLSVLEYKKIRAENPEWLGLDRKPGSF